MRYVEALVEESNITKGKIYEAIYDDVDGGIVTIKQNNGILQSYYMIFNSKIWFRDVTTQVRNTTIDNILTE